METTPTSELSDLVVDVQHITTTTTTTTIPAAFDSTAPVEQKAERDEIRQKIGDETDIPPGLASGTINKITYKPEMTMVAATSLNTTVTTGATTIEQHNMKQCNCEELEAERLENGEERKEENQEELRNEEMKQEATKEVCTQTAGNNVPHHQSGAFNWVTNIDESSGPAPTEHASCTLIT